ncbi:hypothetical protein [Streptomyces sp. NPDC059092]|uniref:hypothetical protein n=1 Tax=Streptomyces sp. NPDC059092 TaxID=3346725 RepID=UPI0036D1240D
MSTPTNQVRALFAQVSAHPYGAPLVRRTGGDGSLSVPVEGMELCPQETAAALFEVEADDDPAPSTDTLYSMLRASMQELGPAGLARTVTVFSDLDPGEFWEVSACHTFAYRLALSFWYEGARARPMTAGEAATALYLSGHHRHATRMAGATPFLSRAVREGAAVLPTETLIRLGALMGAELAGAHTSQAAPDWLYRQILPDRQRRQVCFDLVRAHPCRPLPLVVRLDDGTHLLGTCPPPRQDGTWPRTTGVQW